MKSANAGIIKMTQEQYYYKAAKKSAGLNQAFLEMVSDGMTKTELEKLIEKRPIVYRRFAHWLDVLKD